MSSLLPQPGGAHELSEASSPSTSTASTSASAPSSASSTSSSSLLSNIKRRISTRKNSLKETLPARLLLRRDSKNGGNSEEVSTPSAVSPGVGGPLETQGNGTMEHPRAYTIAPPDHRQNTTLRAVTDSFPLLASLHAPSLPFTLPTFSSSSSRVPSPSLPRSSVDGYDDSEDDSPTASPPLGGLSRRNSPPGLSASPAPSSRRGSHPEQPSHSSSTSSANNNNNKADDPLDRLYGNVVMLGGFRGSTLRDAKTGKRLWIPLRVGFGFRQADLGLGLEDEDELRSTETVVPGNMLCALGGVVDLGKKLKGKLKSVQAAQSQPPSHPSFPFTTPSPSPSPPPRDPLRPALQFHSFGYDWRRSLELSSAELLAKLETLKRASAERGEGEGGKGVGATVIAHSMGGLVVMHALAQAEDPTIFRGIVFAGTPFQGCINILGALKLGGAVPRNPKTGDPATVLSWRSCFYFLPRPPAVVAPPPEKGTEERRACEVLVEEQLQGSGAECEKQEWVRKMKEKEMEREGKQLQVEVEVEATPKAGPASLPPPVGVAEKINVDIAAASTAYPTPPLTPTPLTSSPTARSASSSSTSSSSSSRSSRSSPNPTPYTTSSPSPSHLASKPQIQPLPPSTHLHPSTHLPPLSTLLSGCFETPAGTPIPVDLYDPDSYSRYALSPAVAGMNLSRDRSRIAAPETETENKKSGLLRESEKQQRGDDSSLPVLGGPGNLGEASALSAALGVDHASSPIEAATSGVERLQAELDHFSRGSSAAAAEKGRGEGLGAKEREAESRLMAEEKRLKQQVGEEETVRGYLERCLERAQKFHEDIINLYDPSKAAAGLYPPVSVLSSRSTPTVRGVLVSSRDKIVEEGYDRLLWAEGDGIVLYETATRLPGDPEVEGRKRGEGDDKWHGLLKGVVETQNGHVSMLGDLDGVRECLRLLYD
ncbi:hypothetical protein JCM11251_007682 [Rhodosporidiobolus azoricus]